METQGEKFGFVFPMKTVATDFVTCGVSSCVSSLFSSWDLLKGSGGVLSSKKVIQAVSQICSTLLNINTS